MQFKLNLLFRASLCCQFVGTSNPLDRNISLANFMIFWSLVFSNDFYKILKIFHHFYSFFTNTHTGSTPKFGRAPELILGRNKTSILFKDFKCNETSNSNAKYPLNRNFHVQHYGSGRGQAFSKTLRFSITLLAGRSLLYGNER